MKASAGLGAGKNEDRTKQRRKGAVTAENLKREKAERCFGLKDKATTNGKEEKKKQRQTDEERKRQGATKE